MSERHQGLEQLPREHADVQQGETSPSMAAAEPKMRFHEVVEGRPQWLEHQAHVSAELEVVQHSNAKGRAVFVSSIYFLQNVGLHLGRVAVLFYCTDNFDGDNMAVVPTRALQNSPECANAHFFVHRI